MLNPKLCADGWLLGRDESSNKTAYVAYLKVDTSGTKDNREHFTVMEGPLKGKKGSVIPTVNGLLSLVDVAHDGEGLIFVDFKKSQVADGKMSGVLWMGSRPTLPKPSTGAGTQGVARHAAEVALYKLQMAVAIPLVTMASNPLPAGWSPLEIPDAPHHGGTYYGDKSPFATVWFRVGHEGDRYLHPGRFSAGCGTVQPEQWTPVYNYLIHRRKDVQSVGAMHVAYID